MRIPLPQLLRNWRFLIHEQGLTDRTLTFGLFIWAHLAKRPMLYHLAFRWLIRVLALGAKKKGRYKYLPGLKAWTQTRDFPAPQGKTFMQEWRENANV